MQVEAADLDAPQPQDVFRMQQPDNTDHDAGDIVVSPSLTYAFSASDLIDLNGLKRPMSIRQRQHLQNVPYEPHLPRLEAIVQNDRLSQPTRVLADGPSTSKHERLERIKSRIAAKRNNVPLRTDRGREGAQSSHVLGMHDRLNNGRSSHRHHVVRREHDAASRRSKSGPNSKPTPPAQGVDGQVSTFILMMMAVLFICCNQSQVVDSS